MDQAAKAHAFKALHERKKLFVIPNPWDGASAKLLASLGFEALTTTSAGLAFVIGKPDNGATREESLANAKLIVESVDLPVAADLENGFGHRPEDAAETIRLAAAVGLVGGSIEDSSNDPAKPIYDFNLAVERVAAAAEAAHGLGFPFMFVARCENHLHGRDFDDTLKRLQAYEKAGADVLFAPGLPGIDAIRTVCAETNRPINVVQSAGGIPLADLQAAGVRRVSTGGGLARVALSAVKAAGEELLSKGTYSFADNILSLAALNALMRGK